jgi:hypothetical protein
MIDSLPPPGADMNHRSSIFLNLLLSMVTALARTLR